MKYVLKNQEMQDVDKETIQQIGMPGLVLMERASEKIARRLMETVRYFLWQDAEITGEMRWLRPESFWRKDILWISQSWGSCPRHPEI